MSALMEQVQSPRSFIPDEKGADDSGLFQRNELSKEVSEVAGRVRQFSGAGGTTTASSNSNLSAYHRHGAPVVFRLKSWPERFCGIPSPLNDI